jgi:hypothetical protein
MMFLLSCSTPVAGEQGIRIMVLAVDHGLDG